jgi:3-mercaptopyruvate sulfurtransferase SseA
VRRGPRGGRIPGAVSLPRRALVDEAAGWLLPLDRQRAVLEEALGVALPPPPDRAAGGPVAAGGRSGAASSSGCGVAGDRKEAGGAAGEAAEEAAAPAPQVVLYCNGGVAACTAALALARLGYPGRVSVYDGSWNEWSARSDLPAEGPGPGTSGGGGGGAL